MIDTHCHLTFPDYHDRVDRVLDRARSRGVTGAITISTNAQDCHAALATATHYPNVWCSAGVHPLYSDGPNADGSHDWDSFARVAAHPRCVAFGELGLDNHYREPHADVQRRVLDHHLELIANHPNRPTADDDPTDPAPPDSRGKPVVLHCRDAFDDLVPILQRSGLPPHRFVFHCFTAGPREMQLLLDFGASVSFTGVLTYRNAPEVREAAALAPLDRVMVETDAPFLSPQAVRKRRPNEPAYVVHIAQQLADIHGASLDDIHTTLNNNTARFFGIHTEPGSPSTDPLDPLDQPD